MKHPEWKLVENKPQDVWSSGYFRITNRNQSENHQFYVCLYVNKEHWMPHGSSFITLEEAQVFCQDFIETILSGMYGEETEEVE